MTPKGIRDVGGYREPEAEERCNLAERAGRENRASYNMHFVAEVANFKNATISVFF